ncbi:MAG: type II toxin-antitoxin system RelE/ParE family toxin [Candidatus Marinimicrobia bacterium]|nr:type II toxin-antitoxin system RelE/ParE family toxin [Candidatus Neomarinimicrobiota bacterium]
MIQPFNPLDRVPGYLDRYSLYPLKGSRENTWSIPISGNWRLTFKFEDGNAHIVNYEDNH